MVLLAAVLAFTVPDLGSGWFGTLDKGFSKLAERPGLAVLVVGLVALSVLPPTQVVIGLAVAYGGAVSAEHVAECVVRAIESETFLVLPHPEVAEYERRKTADRDRWLAGMRKLKAKIDADSNLRGDD